MAANSELENDVHGTNAEASERPLSSRDGVGQQVSSGRYPATAMGESRPRKTRCQWSLEENSMLIECYMKSIPEKRGYRQRMIKIWKEKGMFNVSEQRLADQVRVILKSDWLTTVELEEIKRRSDLQEMNVMDV